MLKPLPDSLKGVFSIFTLKVKDVRHSSPYHWLSKQDLCKVTPATTLPPTRCASLWSVVSVIWLR